MNWQRVKWLLIGMLVLGNLILAALYRERRDENLRAALQFHDTLVSALTIRGVTLAQEVEERLFDDAFRLYALRDAAREEELAAALLGAVSRLDQGGRMYLYENAAGKALFRGGGQFQAEWTSPPPVEGSLEDDALSLLLRAGFPTDPPPAIERSQSNATVTLVQRINDLPVFDAYVIVRYENDSLVSLSGRWLWGDPLPAEGEPPCPVLGAALMRFAEGQIDAGKPVSYVESVQAGWLLSAFQSDYVCLTPVWRVTADGGEYLVDPETSSVREADTTTSH